MESKETKYSSKTGHIYGSRLSKSGKWLNLYIKVDDVIITCPIRFGESNENKPVASYHTGKSPYAVDTSKAMVSFIPVFGERKEKPKEEQPADDFPF